MGKTINQLIFIDIKYMPGVKRLDYLIQTVCMFSKVTKMEFDRSAS